MVFTQMLSSLMEVNPYLAIAVFFALPFLYVAILPGQLSHKIAVIYWLTIILLGTGIVPSYEYMRVIFALVGGIATAIVMFRIFQQ